MSTATARLILVVNALGAVVISFGQPHDWLWYLSGIVLPTMSFTLAAFFPYCSKRAVRLKRAVALRLTSGR